MKKKNSINKIGFFNLAKGIGLILVILGHSVIMVSRILDGGDSMSSFADSWQMLGAGFMAMFFIASGCGFYHRKTKKCITTQLKLTLKPYAVTSVAIIAAKLVLAVLRHRPFMENGGERLLTHLLVLNASGGGTLFGIPIDYVGILWFLIALMNGWIIYNEITGLKNEQLKKMLPIVCVAAGYLLTLISRVWPFCIPMSLLAVGYLAAGDYIHKNQLLEKELPVWVYLLMGGFSAVSMVFGGADIATCYWKLGPIDVVSTFCLGFLILKGFAFIQSLELKGALVSRIEAIGFNSIWVILAHEFETFVVPSYRVTTLLMDHPVAAILVTFCFRCAVVYVIYQFIKTVDRLTKQKKRKNRKVTITGLQ